MIESHLVSELLEKSLIGRRHAFLTVISNSMEPMIKKGDEIKIVGATIEDISPGDVIALNIDNSLLAHRLWRLDNREGTIKLITRGDRLPVLDRPHLASDLIGLVVARRRQGRSLELEQGKGRWLNTQLARISSLESRLLQGRRSSSMTPSWPRESFAEDSELITNRRLVRIVHRLFYSISWVLTQLIR